MHEIIHDRLLFKYCCNIIRGIDDISFIYERTSPFHTTGLRLSKKFGIPLILEVNDPLDELIQIYPSILKPYLLHLEAKLLAESHGIIVGSRRLRDYFAEKTIDKSKIRVVYPTADYTLFNPTNNSKSTAGQLSPRSSPILGYIGSMAPWHRIDLLLDALPRILNKFPKSNLLLVGDGPEKEKMIALTKNLGIHPNVTFTGPVNYEFIPEYIRIMDICVIPSATWYGSPTKLFEYGAMAKPIVGPQNTPVDEIIDNPSLGSLVQLGNSQHLASTIIQLLENINSTKELGRNLYRKLTTEITWHHNVEIICSLV